MFFTVLIRVISMCRSQIDKLNTLHNWTCGNSENKTNLCHISKYKICLLGKKKEDILYTTDCNYHTLRHIAFTQIFNLLLISSQCLQSSEVCFT